MIIDIGGGTSEIAVIALGGIVNNKSIRIAGDDFNADIEEYMRKSVAEIQNVEERCGITRPSEYYEDLIKAKIAAFKASR
jgi:actin-like ATPase involved in cell morphogenesis